MWTVAWVVVVATVYIIVIVLLCFYVWWKCSRQNIGINLNEWQFPVKEFSGTDKDMTKSLKRLECVSGLDISKKVWEKTTSVVDEILDTLLQEMRVQSSEYEGLKLDRYRKQGSAREGLKIRTTDEFDVLLEYHIEGLWVEAEPLVDFGIPYPGLGKMKIHNSDHEIENQFTSWLNKGVIVKDKGIYFLNARILHQAVFESMIDRCRGYITNITTQNLPFQLTRSMNPPSIKITIKRLKQTIGFGRKFVNLLLRKPKVPKVIDVDIVPAMTINVEEARGPRGFVKCPRYAVVKWIEESKPSAWCYENPAMIWRLCISGYEKHYMDLARKDRGKRHIMTACRIMKTFIDKEQEKSRSGYQPLSISMFLSSYHLKNIAFYCMLHTDSVKSVYEGLGYFLGFMKLCLEEEKLLQFFRGNKFLNRDFPACAEGGQVNLFRDVKKETFFHVLSSFHTMLDQFSGMYDTDAFESVANWKFRKSIKPIRNGTCSIS